jgi:hypothetical protein
MKNVSDKFGEKLEKHILLPVTFFLNLGISEIMWEHYLRARQATDDNMVQAR